MVFQTEPWRSLLTTQVWVHLIGSIISQKEGLTCRKPLGSFSLMTSRQYSINPVVWRSFTVQWEIWSRTTWKKVAKTEHLHNKTRHFSVAAACRWITAEWNVKSVTNFSSGTWAWNDRTRKQAVGPVTDVNGMKVTFCFHANSRQRGRMHHWRGC